MRVGIAGTGRMGAAIAARMLDLDHEVHVWNRTAAKLAPLIEAGAKPAATPAELASRCEAVITILTNAASIDEVFAGPDGLLSGEVAGKMFIEMSTVQPHDEQALAEKVRAEGARIVECPVGGTVGPARDGNLLGVAGGERADFEAALPLLQQMCRRVDLVGPIGAGASLKLALNLPLIVYYQALAEALLLCRHLGLDYAWLMEFLSGTSGGPNVLKARGPVIAAALAGAETGDVMFDVDLCLKDLRTMLDEAGRRGVDLPLVERTLSVYEQAGGDGWGPRDAAWLPAYWPSVQPGDRD